MQNNLKKDYYIEHDLILTKKPSQIGIRNCEDKVVLFLLLQQNVLKVYFACSFLFYLLSSKQLLSRDLVSSSKHSSASRSR